jgi:hypothetical protein
LSGAAWPFRLPGWRFIAQLTRVFVDSDVAILSRSTSACNTVTELATIDDSLNEPASLAFSTHKGGRKTVILINFAVMPEHGGSGPALLKIEIGVPGLPLP